MPAQNQPIEPQSTHRPSTPAFKELSRALPARPVRADQRRILVVGAPLEIPRALEHPAVASGRFAVHGILALDAETDDALEVSARVSELLRAHGVDAMLMAGPVGRAAMRAV